jgi:hypothetical protein
MKPIHWCVFVALAILVALGVMVWLQVRTKPNAQAPRHPLDQTLDIIRRANREERAWLAILAFCSRAGRGVAVAIIVATLGVTSAIAGAICGVDWVPMIEALERFIHRYRCDSAALRGRPVPQVCTQ